MRSIPLHPAYRAGDVVLHDGELRGERALGQHTYQVFDQLTRLEQSAMTTFVTVLSAQHQDDIDALRKMVMREGGFVEDWTANIRYRCQACSEGRAHTHDEPTTTVAWQPERQIALALSLDPHDLIRAWASRSPETRQVIEHPRLHSP